MERILSSEVSKLVGKSVSMSGWVHARRDHGKLIFIDLRDRDGLTQVVILPSNKEAYKVGKDLRPGWVIEVSGMVKARPEKMINEKIASGTVEVEAKSVEVLNEAKTLPFEVDKDTSLVGEEVRMKYRYLDIRSERIKRNLEARAKAIAFATDWLTKRGFTYVETPYISKGTPEGAREFVIPSRLHHGMFYTLPQAPQQFKQLLMVAGIERYFQIARCFRDEDPRGDRQAEFTQIDIEMSFVEEEDVRGLVEEMLTEMVKSIWPEKKFTALPFPRIPYAEAMGKYGSDKPDLREVGPWSSKRSDLEKANELAFCWIVDFPLFKKENGKLEPSHNPFTRPYDEDVKLLDKDPLKVRAHQYDLVLNGYEVAGGALRIFKRDLQEKIFGLLGHNLEDIRQKFGHLLEAFEYGAPPHGGIAAGIDRICAILQNEPSIREVIAFPKTGDGRDLLMGAPAEITSAQLKELGIKII